LRSAVRRTFALLRTVEIRRHDLGPFGGEETTTGGTVNPVALEARLEEPLSRWLWPVKGRLAIPRFILLFFLWIAFFVIAVAASLAILVTGRYPRSLFDFNLGVLRRVIRVAGYATLMTDTCPPFRLDQGGSDPPGSTAATRPAFADSRGCVMAECEGVDARRGKRSVGGPQHGRGRADARRRRDSRGHRGEPPRPVLTDPPMTIARSVG
jgi:hypothetical protein